jgi:hypothetical protein
MSRLLRSCVFLFSIAFLHSCGVTEQLPHPPYATDDRPVKGTSSIAFISDTQSPLWFEAIPLREDNNEEATQFLLRSIAADSSITSLFHLGDLVALGSFKSYWVDFDASTLPLRTARIPLYPVFGNHEYMPFASRGRREMIRRFPMLDSSWYSRRVGNIAVILLNSNFSHLGDSAIAQQSRWYESELSRLDGDSAITMTIVALHHSPFTNSTIVSSSQDVQREFVPGFLRSQKARLFVSGHAHAFEHFRQSGKDFLVIGGGGGLLQPLFRGTEQKYSDLFQHTSDRRFFHFLRCDVRDDLLVARVLRVSTDRTRLDTAYAMTIPLLPTR